MAGPDRGADASYSAPRVAWQLRDFDIVRRLGDGSFSHVIQVTHKATGDAYALKIVDKHLILRNKQVEKVKRERALLDRLRDPGIVRLHFTFQDEASLYFGLELCPNGELFDQIRLKGRLPEAEARQYAAEAVLILQCLRAQQVVHCDLKPENLLLDAGGRLKLADFGSALCLPQAAGGGREGAGKRCASLTGTADYVSPEMLDGQAIGPAADLWALGCILFQMLAGTPPFRAASEYLTMQKVAAAEFELPDGIPPAAGALIRELLVLEPKRRIGAGEAGLAELQWHAFFKGVDWAAVRSSPAPELAQEAPAADGAGDAHDDFDWELSSLAASLPLKVEYDAPGRAP